ncbi:DNA-processing protein DprA [Roseibacillus persicicus]|uniref:DNA-processing protein DprA n=1 Tax=Roseibacillus persicicus TaxID=454148 RepID=UPI00280EB569|nr:DNA-processing protein DprA [Roseibacillus persicicus]MDQ8189172.1 DNA-processing protein DprA [Roseibacillus persicicus]
MLSALLTLNALPKVGPIRLRRLLRQFGNPETILAQTSTSLQSVSGIGPEVASIICDWQTLTDADAELALCERHGITILTPKSLHWPRQLAESPDAPLLLYVKGEVTEADQHAIGVVGSRRCTHYGRATTRNFASGLARSGYTIISGLARGIDTEAHQAALDAGGRTIAVLGSGLLNLYPSENRDLAERIADGHGAVVSEFPLRCPPDKQTFPQRNRIVANWSTALLVTESPRRSGSLITAGMASDAGRPVYAIPGPVDRPQSEGCHDLIREGASLVFEPNQILRDLQELPLFQTNSKSAKKESPAKKENPVPALNEVESTIYSQITSEELTMDQIADRAGSPIHLVSATLLGLEMKGLVKQMAGQRYVRTFN